MNTNDSNNNVNQTIAAAEAALAAAQEALAQARAAAGIQAPATPTATVTVLTPVPKTAKVEEAAWKKYGKLAVKVVGYGVAASALAGGGYYGVRILLDKLGKNGELPVEVPPSA